MSDDMTTSTDEGTEPTQLIDASLAAKDGDPINVGTSVMDSAGNGDGNKPKPDLPRRRGARIALAVCGALVVIALVVGGGYLIGSRIGGDTAEEAVDSVVADEDDSANAVSVATPDEADADSEAATGTETDADADTGEEHEHTWVAVYALQEVPAVTHTEHHDAVYGTETVYETVCNTCGEIVTGATREHTSSTGHTSFTTNVPITNEVIVTDAYDETVVDTPATVQLVHTADRCSTCGEEVDVEDEVIQTIDGEISGD